MDLGEQRSALISDYPHNQSTITQGKKQPLPLTSEIGLHDDSRHRNFPRSSEYQGFEETFAMETSPPKQPRAGVWDRFSRFESETWLLEIVSMCISVTAMILAVVYLKRFDGKAIPEWPKGITLNTVLSVCITIMGAASSIPVSSGLGQLIWIRAKHESVPLSKLDMLDKASRGVWGGLMVIFGWAGGALGALGGLAIVLAFVSTPLSQQAIHVTTDSSLSLIEQASIARCKGGSGMSSQRVLYRDGKGTTDGSVSTTRNPLPSLMRGAYYNALYSNFASASFSDSFATCRTGNCTWEPFSTLSFCTQCKNVTSNLVSSTFNNGPTQTFTQYTLPGSVNLNPRIQFNVTDSQPSDRIHHSYVTAMLFAAADYVSNNDASGSTHPEAVECALSYCVQVVQPRVENGLLEEVVLEKYDFDDSTITERVRAHTIHPPLGNAHFKEAISVDFVDPEWVKGAASFQGAIGINVPAMKPETYLLMENGLDKMQRTFDNVATAMGRALRVTCNGTEMVAGSAWISTPIVRIRWYWLAVPFLVEMLALLFFATIVIMNYRSRTKLRKTSFLATCMYSVKLGESRYGQDLDQALKSRVRLVDNIRGEEGKSRLIYT